MRPLRPTTYVRYETADGEGLFSVISRFADFFDFGAIRLSRVRLNEVRLLIDHVRALVPSVPARAYRDSRSRRPITWFRASAGELVAKTDRLVRVLNQCGANLHRIESDSPPTILWEDDVQVVTRRARKPEAIESVDIIRSRQLDRRKKLVRKRLKASYRKARERKGCL